MKQVCIGTFVGVDTVSISIWKSVLKTHDCIPADMFDSKRPFTAQLCIAKNRRQHQHLGKHAKGLLIQIEKTRFILEGQYVLQLLFEENLTPADLFESQRPFTTQVCIGKFMRVDKVSISIQQTLFCFFFIAFSKH